MNNPLIYQGFPAAHQLASQSPLVDSGVSLDLLANHHNMAMMGGSVEIEDDVFVAPQQQMMQQQKTKASSEEKQMIVSSSSTDSSSSSNTIVTSAKNSPNGLNRSKRTSFPKKENSPDSTLKAFDDGEFSRDF